MVKKGIIYSDMDGTLLFHGKIHGIEKVEDRNGGLVLVRDPKAGTEHLAHDVSTPLYTVFLDVRTRELCKQLRADYEFIIVSGCRQSTMDGRKHLMDFADGYILEGGGLILDGDYNQDMEWDSRLAPEVAYLPETRDRLGGNGWKFDDRGRRYALRVRKKDNAHKTDAEFEELWDNVELPPQLRKTMNIGSLDIIPASSGKGNAVKYFTAKKGFDISQTIGLGDDINDVELLEATARSFLLGSAYEEALNAARGNGWYISQAPHFDGIHEILDMLI